MNPAQTQRLNHQGQSSWKLLVSLGYKRAISSRAPIGYLAIAETPVSINQDIIAMLTDPERSAGKFSFGTYRA